MAADVRHDWEEDEEQEQDEVPAAAFITTGDEDTERGGHVTPLEGEPPRLGGDGFLDIEQGKHQA